MPRDEERIWPGGLGFAARMMLGPGFGVKERPIRYGDDQVCRCIIRVLHERESPLEIRQHFDVILDA